MYSKAPTPLTSNWNVSGISAEAKFETGRLPTTAGRRPSSVGRAQGS
jgi:hypothetical protein